MFYEEKKDSCCAKELNLELCLCFKELNICALECDKHSPCKRNIGHPKYQKFKIINFECVKYDRNDYDILITIIYDGCEFSFFYSPDELVAIDDSCYKPLYCCSYDQLGFTGECPFKGDSDFEELYDDDCECHYDEKERVLNSFISYQDPSVSIHKETVLKLIKIAIDKYNDN